MVGLTLAGVADDDDGVAGAASDADRNVRASGFRVAVAGVNFRSWRSVACLFPHLAHCGRSSQALAM